MKVQIWMEGHRATGESSSASMIGEYEASDWDDAIRQYKEAYPHHVDTKRVPKNIKSVRDDNFTNFYSIWACRLFDNEADARKSFG